MSHTAGKLTINGKWIRSESGHEVAYFGLPDMDEADARRLVACWNEHDDLVAERDRYKKRCQELREGGLRLIEDHSQRTLDAMTLRAERDELVKALDILERLSGIAMMEDDPVRVAARTILARYQEGK
ncbi:MAG: hypothetical protein RBT80_27235 [Candidatus Vecturithrix sp.]|jgi:hypothetical protein|nr:hypothetical protein [Candidatus Vecturithrix sp.]